MNLLYNCDSKNIVKICNDNRHKITALINTERQNSLNRLPSFHTGSFNAMP